MTDAPERIRVAQDADGFWTCREAVSGSQEYVRADLYAALEAQIAGRTGGVKVKPLEWRGTDGVWHKAYAEFGGLYRITEYQGMAEPYKLETHGWWEGLPCGLYKTLEEAKAAAQADYERRILSALPPASEAHQEPVEWQEPELTCPHIERAVMSGELSPAMVDELAAIREINSQLRYGTWALKAQLKAITRPEEQEVTDAMVRNALHTYITVDANTSEEAMRAAIKVAMETKE